MRKDMTIGNPMKIILLFSLPVLLGNLFKSINSAMMHPFCSVNFVIIFLIFNNAFWFRLVVFLECK